MILNVCVCVCIKDWEGKYLLRFVIFFLFVFGSVIIEMYCFDFGFFYVFKVFYFFCFVKISLNLFVRRLFSVGI